MRCYCAKNWYRTYACRIKGERSTRFPFQCPLSHILRAHKITTTGLRLRPPGEPARVLHIREPSFLDNPRTPKAIKVR